MNTKAKVMSFAITASIIALLFAIGPAKAFLLNVVISNNLPMQGDNISFSVQATVEDADKLNVTEFQLLLEGPSNVMCKFTPNGTIISGCDGITIQLLGMPDFNFGY